MSVPVFDPKAWCLLYFSIPESEALPIHPGEFFSAEPREVRLNLLSHQPGVLRVWPCFGPEDLYASMKEALDHDIFRCSGKLFTVHKISLLERLRNWMQLSRSAELALPMGLPTRWMIPVVDLVEEFHRPAILTYQHRKEFGADLINYWLGRPATTTQDTLWRLCHIL